MTFPTPTPPQRRSSNQDSTSPSSTKKGHPFSPVVFGTPKTASMSRTVSHKGMAVASQSLPHALAVTYPSTSHINERRFGMVAKKWKLIDPHAQALLHTMCTDAEAVRRTVDSKARTEDPGRYYREIAEALRNMMLNGCWYVQLARNQRKAAYVLDWLGKREDELVPLLEAFTTQVGNAGAGIEVFIDHGYTPFLSARIRFLAAFERIYNIDPPLPPSERKIKVSNKRFVYYDKLQAGQRARWSPLEPEQSAYFTHPLLDHTWKCHHPVRKYNWHIPLAAPTPELIYAHDMMISHGISLWHHVSAYGSDQPILLSAVQVLEKTLDLCTKATTRYWQLVKALPPRWKYLDDGEGKKYVELPLQRAAVRQNMEVCLVVWRDLERAKGNIELSGAVEGSIGAQGTAESSTEPQQFRIAESERASMFNLEDGSWEHYSAPAKLPTLELDDIIMGDSLW